MLKLAAIPLGLVLLVVGAVAWSGGGAERRADFTFINRGDVKTLDPNRMSWLQDIRLGYALWEGLYALDPITLEAVPGISTAADVSPDALTYTFHVRPGAGWSNGDPVRPGDFAFAWKRMLDSPGDYTQLFEYIRGVKAYREAVAAGRRGDFASVGIETPDDRTVRVTLEHPVTYFLDIVAFPPFFPLHEPSMRRFASPPDPNTGAVSYDQEFTRPPGLVTNGPYRLDSWQFKRRLRLVANDHYWDRANVKSRVIDALSADDNYVAYLMYDGATVDWLSDVNPEIAYELRRAGRTDLRVSPGFGTYFYSVNCQPALPGGEKNPLADVRVRLALSMAMDRQPVVDNVTRMGEPAALEFVPPGVFPDYPSPRGAPRDPGAARRLLADAGYPGGAGFPRLHLLVNTGAYHESVAQVFLRQWRQELGIDLELEAVEVKTFGNRLRSKDYAIARASWMGDYNDVSTFTDKYLATSENNDSGWINPKYDDLCARAALERDPQARLKLLADAEGVMLAAQPIIPVFHYVNSFLHRDRVLGIPTNPRQMVNFKSVEVRR